MTQTCKPSSNRTKERKKKLRNCFQFHQQVRQSITEGSHNKSFTVWLQAWYDFLLGEPTVINLLLDTTETMCLQRKVYALQ